MSNSTKEMTISRRAALAGIGTAALTACKKKWTPPEQDPYGLARAKAYVPGAEAWSTHEERWANTSCAQCAAGCGIRVRVVEGRAVRIEGNELNPLNRGGIGPRGLAGLQVLYDPDRITGPMIRKEGRLQSATWQEALALVGNALKSLREKDGAHKLLVLSGRERGMMNELLQRFTNAYGSVDFVDGRPNRSSVIAQAMEAMTGSFEIPSYDWGSANYVLSLEAGLLEDSCQSVAFARTAARRRQDVEDARTTLIHAGPAFDLTASSADQWLRLRPGSAGAFALGLCRELLFTQRYDRRAVEAQVVDLSSFKEAVDSYIPERVAQLTGLEAKHVVRVAAELARNRPSFAYIDDRSVAYSNGLESAQAVLALNALLGAIEAPKGGLRIAGEAPMRSWPSPVLDEIATRGSSKARLDRAGSAEFPRARSVHETLVEAIDSSPPEIALLYYSNPVYARHQPARWRSALAKIPLLVSFSPFLDETVSELAHVVLPDHTYLERFEDATPAPGINRALIGVHKPVVVPLHDTKASGDVLLQLAQHIGGSVAQSLPWAHFKDAVDARLLGLHDARRGSVRAETEGAFLAEIYHAGYWEDSGTPIPKSLRLKLSADWSEAKWAGDAQKNPLKLVLYRPLGHAVGSGANQTWLHNLRARPGARAWEHVALVHPSSATGLSNGDSVRIASDWGEVTMSVRLELRMSPGFVAISLGRGHTAYGRFAKGIGINAMHLVAPGAAPITGASVLCGTRVRLQREVASV